MSLLTNTMVTIDYSSESGSGFYSIVKHFFDTDIAGGISVNYYWS